MHSTLYLEIVAALSEHGFSFDELVIRSRELFEQDGIPGFVALLIALFDEVLYRRLLAGEVISGIQLCGCGQRHLELVKLLDRRLRTSAGTVQFQWRQLRCRACGRSWIPLKCLADLARCQSKTAELEQLVVEGGADQTYRRAASTLEAATLVRVPPTTFHRWVMTTECDVIAPIGKLVDVLYADGTGYKRRPTKTQRSNRGELRVVIGIDEDGRTLPFGSWTTASWQEIAQHVQGHPADGSVPAPIAKLLMTDGEPGLVAALASLAQDHARCHWHQVTDLNYSLLNESAYVLKTRRSYQKKRAHILEIALPVEDFELVTDAQKTEIAAQVQRAEDELDALIALFRKRKCYSTAGYLENAKSGLFAHVRLWLAFGIVAPRATSVIERMMREFGRRLKRMAFGWSEAGAAKIARIILKRITTVNAWKEFWEQRLKLTGSVLLVYRGWKVKTAPT